MRCVFCPGCVFGFWYNWGIMQRYDKNETYFMTISGSSLAAVCVLCNLKLERQLIVCNSLRPLVFRFQFHQLLRKWLEEELPENCHEICKGYLCILVRKFPSLQIQYFTNWRDKKHLIDTLIAACSPFYPYHIDGCMYIDCVDCKCPENYSILPDSRTIIWPPCMTIAKKLFLEGKQFTKN